MFKDGIIKNSYNQGTRIATSADPTWSLEDDSDHTPITPTHTPCGYWPGTMTTPKEYTYIVAILSNCTIARINYYTGEIDPTSGVLPNTVSAPGDFPTIYKEKLYVWADSRLYDSQIYNTLFEYDLDAKITTRVLPLIVRGGNPGPGYRVGNMLYLNLSGDNYGGYNQRIRVHEIDLDTFSVTGRVFALPYSYGPILNMVIKGNLMFVVTWTYIVAVDFRSFTFLSQYLYADHSDGVSAVFTNDKTACIVVRNDYTPCLMKLSLTNPPTLLATKDTDWLPYMSPNTATPASMTIDYDDNVYVGDKFQLKMRKFNGALWDTPVTYSYVDEYSYGRDMTFSSPKVAGEDLWCCNNYTWIDDYRRIFRIKKDTMKVEHVVVIPTPPYVPSIRSVVIY